MIRIGLFNLFALTLCCLPGKGFGQNSSWYKSYTGTISKYPITLHLHNKGGEYSGYYYYTSRQEPIQFSGNIIQGTDSIWLSAGKDERFDFIISGNKLNGKWRADKNTKALDFSATEINSPLVFEYIYTEGSQPLRPKMKDSPAFTFNAEAVWPKTNSAQALLLKKLIRKSFDEKNSSDDIGKIFLGNKKTFFAGHLEENKDVTDEDIKERYSYNQDYSSQTQVFYNSSKLLVLVNHFYTYTGGAHGMYGTSYIATDLVNNKQLTLDEIINSAGRKQLPRLLEKSFRKAYEVKGGQALSEEWLFEDKIEPNDNFYVTAKGIGFCYTPYEIASYAVGQIDIFIPFTELNTYLQPSFKKLIE